MSAEDAKPVETAPPAAEPAAEPIVDKKPAEPTAPAAETTTTAADIKPVEETTAKLDETPKTEETAAAAAVEEKKETKKPVEPIFAGHLRYKAPANFPKNLINQAHELYFWLGDEAAVETKHFSNFLATAKTDYARNAVAWSSQTGKGLFYYGKSKDHKDTPSGVLPLAEAVNIATKGTTEFIIELGGHKHVFITTGEQEREGWLKALKPEAEAASAKKEEVHGSEGFKKALDESKPAPVVAGVERITREDNANSKDKAKSRSVSRGKRGSLFDRLSGKKEESKEEPAKADEPAAEATVPAATETTPAETTETAAPAAEAAPAVAVVDEAKKEESKAEEPKDEIAKADQPKREEPAKVERRSSRLGDFFKKISSPTHEKKEADVVPVAPVAATAPVIKEPETTDPAEPAAETEAPKADEPVAATSATAEATTPTKEKKKFFDVGKMFPKEKSKSPTTETAPTAEAPAISEPAAETEAPKAAETPAVNGDAKAAPAESKDKRRSSFFTGDLAGSIKKLGQKVEKKAEPSKAEPTTDGEASKTVEPPQQVVTDIKATEPKKEKENPLSQLGRRVSTALRGGKREAKKETATPANVEETPETAESSTAAAAPKIEEPVKEGEKVEEAKPTETSAAPQAIGDVVPEAVNIGSAPSANNTVQATA